jgi:hypothetical protein
LPRRTYEAGSSSFAQPSGLTSDGKWLYVADSEGSSVRAIPLSGQGDVRTLIGTSKLPRNRLFTFGDVDGAKEKALLQHPLGVSYYDGKVYVADTYNNKVKVVDAQSGDVATLIGSKDPGNSDDPATFDEPGGLFVSGKTLYIADTNNHAIRVYNFDTKQVRTLVISGLTPPKRSAKPEDLKLPEGKRMKIAAREVPAGLAEIKVRIQLELIEGLKLNTFADFPITVIQPGFANMNMQTTCKVEGDTIEFDLRLPEADEQVLQIAVGYYYCQDDEQGLCLADTVILDVPLKRNAKSGKDSLEIKVALEP